MSVTDLVWAEVKKNPFLKVAAKMAINPQV